jgi:hypothetical protein
LCSSLVLPRATWEEESYRLGKSGSFTLSIFPHQSISIYHSESAQNPTKHRLIQTLSLTTMHVMSLAPSSLPAPRFGYIFLVASALLLAIGTHALLFSALFPPSHGGGAAGDGQGMGTGEVLQIRQQQQPAVIIRSITIAVLDALARDTHYKYLALFSVPVCAYFVIANWVGWQFFRNS